MGTIAQERDLPSPGRKEGAVAAMRKFRDAAGSLAARKTAAKERDLISASGRTGEGASEMYKLAPALSLSLASCFHAVCNEQRIGRT